MNYYFSTTLASDFPSALERTEAGLKDEGFGVLTRIDVKDTMKQKLGVEFRNYAILGACNPPFAHRALSVEDKIGTMLPCNVIVQELGEGRIEVAAIDPVVSMEAVGNPELKDIAAQVRGRLRAVIEKL